MIKIDKDNGNILWTYRTVPFSSECDSDWAAGATVMNTSCGPLVASVEKDGWSYAIEAASTPSCPLTGHSWQFPPTTNGCTFPPNTCPSSQDQGTAAHGDDDYRRPGAAWNDVFVVRTGGESRMQDGVTAGYSRLHALNACAPSVPSDAGRVRWIADIPHSTGGEYSLGTATVTGGVVFVGTDQGHVVVFGDPSVAPPAAGYRCSNIDYTTASSCNAAGFTIVPIPRTLADVQVWDQGSLAAMRGEPVLANGKVFVGTAKGHVYMLQP
jgi:outer membrane protein assembly factor BamB